MLPTVQDERAKRGRCITAFFLDGQGTLGYGYEQRFLGTAHDMIRHPMSYTLGTAAKATGKSKSTIHRAIKSGRISASYDESGVYSIDPSELHRVFAPVSENRHAGPARERSVPSPETHVLLREIALLSEERERERRQMQEMISDLRHRLDEEAAERRKLTTLLTSKPIATTASERKKGFWSWLLGWT